MCAFFPALFPCIHKACVRVRACVHVFAGHWRVSRVDSHFEVKLREASAVDVLLGGGTSGWFAMQMTLCYF